MIVTVPRYMAATRDTSTPPSEVVVALTDAQAFIEGELDRALEEDEYTETLFVAGNGRVYPTVTPVTDAGDYIVEGNAVIVSDFFSPPIDFITGERSTVDITYTGGYTTDTLPRELELAIIHTAYDDLHTESTVPVGATSVRLGDAAVTYANPSSSDVRSSTRRTINRYRKRRL